MTTTTPRQRKTNGFYFAQGDAELLKALAEFHLLQPMHLAKLVGRHVHSLRRRLLQLHRNRLVDRFTLPLERSWLLANPPGGYVYGLSARGLERAQTLGFADQRTRFNSEKRNTFLAHEIRLTDVHVALELAARAGHWQLLSWEQRRAELLDSVQVRGGERLPINPDSLFGLKNPVAPADRNSHYFFLELENSRQSKYADGESGLVRKCRAFQTYAEQSRHVEAWGIPDFRLLVLLPTPERVVNFLQTLDQAGLGFKRFWVTDIISIENPNTIAGKIFRTPRDYKTGAVYSLVE